MNELAEASCKQMEEYVDNIKAENGALRRKLQSKAEALLILSKELDQFRTERDQFKLMAEQLQDRCATLKKRYHNKGYSGLSVYTGGVDTEHSGYSMAQLLGETTEKNKALRIELEDVRQRLRDAQGDVKVLRMQLAQMRTCTVVKSDSFPSHQREELLHKLEALNAKCSQMRQDLQVLLDEKEELVTERDAYKCKVHRLNFELNTLLKGDKKNVLDIDSLVMENRYLQDRLQQAEDDMKLTSQALAKYKSMLDKKRNKGTVKLGTNNSSGMLMTHRQADFTEVAENLVQRLKFNYLIENKIRRQATEFTPFNLLLKNAFFKVKPKFQQLVERGTSAQLPNTAATLSDMKSLCSALLDALNDKTLALSHQKKANKILASRISELESRLESLQGGSVVAFPSRHLLEGYTGSEVDREVGQLLARAVMNSEGSDHEGWGNENACNGLENYTLNERKSKELSTSTADVSQQSSLPTSPGSSCGGAEMVNGGNIEVQMEYGRSRKNSDDAETGDLPPQLQVLVSRALEEMKSENVSDAQEPSKGTKSSSP